MADPMTLTAGAIATLAFQKFIESGAGELAKKFTESAIAKMDELRQKIWEKLRGKSTKVDEALAKAEQGDRTAIETITKNLDVAMDEDDTFANAVKALAREINAGKTKQVGLEGIEAKRVEAAIEQTAKGDRVEQIGAKQVKAEEDAVFNIKQTTEEKI